jgi:caa(3)-type oxidase subunit IV
MSTPATHAHSSTHPKPNYWVVFFALAAFTAMMTLTELFRHSIDLTLNSFGIGNPDFLINTGFIVISLIKATLVAMYYMHLKFDSVIYTLLFLMPVLFAVFLVGILAVGYLI